MSTEDLSACRPDRRNRNAPINPNTAKNMFTNRHQRQLRYSVRTPPSSRPMAPPAPAIAPKMPKALPRSLGSMKVVVSTDSADGASNAPNMPCNARAVTRVSKFPAEPPSAETTANPVMPMMNVRLRPTRSARRPPTSRRLPKASE